MSKTTTAMVGKKGWQRKPPVTCVETGESKYAREWAWEIAKKFGLSFRSAEQQLSYAVNSGKPWRGVHFVRKP